MIFSNIHTANSNFFIVNFEGNLKECNECIFQINREKFTSGNRYIIYDRKDEVKINDFLRFFYGMNSRYCCRSLQSNQSMIITFRPTCNRYFKREQVCNHAIPYIIKQNDDDFAFVFYCNLPNELRDERIKFYIYFDNKNKDLIVHIRKQDCNCFNSKYSEKKGLEPNCFNKKIEVNEIEYRGPIILYPEDNFAF